MASKKIIHNWFVTTLYEISNGESIEELLWVLYDFEREEAYEECAGIKKALDLAKGKTIKEIRLEYEEIINKNII